MNPQQPSGPERRATVARAFTLVEDAVCIGLGVVLAGSALTLLVTSVIDFTQSVLERKVNIIALLERILLILLIVELLYTVQVPFREHALLPEPFLLIGLISAIRRVPCTFMAAARAPLRGLTPLGVARATAGSPAPVP